MGSIIALAVNILEAIVAAIPTITRAMIDVRQAFRETARIGKKHVRKAVNAGKRKYNIRRQRYERSKRSNS